VKETMSADIVQVGLRVVRGVDWQWADQDGGEGHVGTIVDIGGQGSNKSPAQTVVVQWDSGVRCNYRAGYQGKDDLRVLDNSPTGVRHKSINCDICKVSGLCGIRWKCTECHNFDLCNDCYMSNKHDLSHVFQRYDTPVSQSVEVAARSKSRRIQAKGLYVGAKVVRGPDWEAHYGDQDGGPGKRGTIKSIGDSSDYSSWRSWVKVMWDVGGANDYRRSHEGFLDVKFVSAANGEQYYVDHLPKLGEYSANRFVDGDSARFNVAALSASDKASLLQKGLLNTTGVVKISDDGQKLEMSFPGRSDAFSLSPSHLVKVRRLEPGDTVKIIDDAQAVQRLQNGHGGWNPQMASALGKTGKVVAIDSDGDAKVAIGPHKWIFNPACCSLVSQGQPQQQAATSNQSVNDDTDDDDDDDDDTNNALAGFLGLMSALMGVQYVTLSPDSLVKEAAEGNTDNVRRILSQFPGQADIKVQNRTALQVAAHQGHQQIVALLLAAGAKSEITDDDGDTAYHYAAYGNQPAVMELLLKKSTAAMNTVNSNSRTSLHVAVCKEHVECVRVLLAYKCNVNTQDNEGDTPLHDAVNKDNNAIVNMLVQCGRVDFKLKNHKGFNVLHQAARRGNQHAVDQIIQKAPQLVNVQKDDGFTALHIAAVNGFILTATTLIEEGKANLEMTTAKFNTPLLIAVDSGQTAIIELLVKKGANLEAEDADGDTALHLVLLQMKNSRQASSMMTLMLNVLFQVQPKDMSKAPEISEICKQISSSPTAQVAWLAIACFLVTHGADIDHKNRAKKSPIDEVEEPKIKELLRKLFKPKAKPRQVTSTTAPSLANNSGLCMMCTTEPVAITFRPCGHKVACSQCSARMKQCFSCHERIQEKVRIDIRPQTAGSRPANAPSNNSTSPRTTATPGISAAGADTVNCPLCNVNVRNVVFQCGHSCCSNCSNNIVKTECHVCDQPIQKRINLF
jgi:E3 ubiquitin-protein ligase mind-bomb